MYLSKNFRSYTFIVQICSNTKRKSARIKANKHAYGLEMAEIIRYVREIYGIDTTPRKSARK